MEQRSNVTAKQNQEILPVQSDDILSRYLQSHFNKKDFYGKVKPGQETVSM